MRAAQVTAASNKRKSPAVVFNHVCFAYGVAHVIRDASFTIANGDFVGVIGPNGGGKSTLLKLMMGLITPQEGSVEVFGRDECEHALAYVPQSIRYDKQFPISVFELVLMGLLNRLPWYGRYKKADMEAAEEALHVMGIAHLKARAVGTLSGGQLQRALIARALVSKPKLLLLDEPTANVDAEAEKEIYQLLKKLSGEVTIVMVTHDLKTAINQVDWVLCVQETISCYAVKEVCEHFALGLYHAPLVSEEGHICQLQVKSEETP